MADQITLAERRFNEGLTPEQLGEKCHISGQTIRRLEAGQRPTPRVAKKLADHFRVKASELFPIAQAAA